MYGREELKPISSLFLDMGIDVEGNRNYQLWKAYDKDEADKVMDAMDARIKELEQRLDDVQNTMATENVDLGMENHKLKERIKELEEANKRTQKHREEAELSESNIRQKMFKMEARIKELEANVPKWISVKDMLPPKNKELIGRTIKGNLISCWFHFPENAIGILSHWTPLPPPPTTEERKQCQKGQ